MHIFMLQKKKKGGGEITKLISNLENPGSVKAEFQDFGD